jgi:hypothetical protein
MFLFQTFLPFLRRLHLSVLPQFYRLVIEKPGDGIL